jgi:hypothetical protein
MALSAFLLVFWATPALGYGTYLCADNDTSCDPYGTALVEDSGGKNSPTQWYGGYYYYCAAESRWGQLCWDSVVNPDTSKLECRQVNSSAHCGCHKTTFETIGSCEQKH